jgi:hypothetical protein
MHAAHDSLRQMGTQLIALNCKGHSMHAAHDSLRQMGTQLIALNCKGHSIATDATTVVKTHHRHGARQLMTSDALG